MKDLVKVFKVSVKSSEDAPLFCVRRDVFFKSYDSAVYDVDTTYNELINNFYSGLDDELIYEKQSEFENNGYVRQACVCHQGVLVLLTVESWPFLLVLREHFKSSSNDVD